MFQDILTVMKKELKEIFAITFMPGHLLSTAVMILLFGFYIPYSMGDFFLRQTSTTLSMYILLLPLVTCSGLVADSFAGERERKTLESLLATRIPDAAVYIGKILAVSIYSYFFVEVIVGASIAGANIYIYKSGAGGDWFFYNALSSFALFVFIIPVILAGATLGVFFSLKCPDLRTAYQFSRLGWVILSLPFITGLLTFEVSWDFFIPAFYALFAATALFAYLGTRLFRRSRLPVA